MTNTVRYNSPEAREAVLRTPMESGMAAGHDKLDKTLAANCRVNNAAYADRPKVVDGQVMLAFSRA